MTHVIHVCAKEPEGTLEAMSKMYGWDLKEIPLNADKHTHCPYCGKSTDEMEPAKTEDTLKLQRNLRAKGSTGPSGGMPKGDYAEVMRELKSLRAAVEAQKKGAGKHD